MAVYVTQVYVAYDGNDVSDTWAEGQAQWIIDNTKVLTGQALVVPGTAGERSSYAVMSEMAPDGTLTPISAWHVNDIGVVVDGLPDGSGTPPASVEWVAGVAYTVDSVVTYSAANYRCLQAHTSQVGWEPPNVPALWVAI